MSPLAQWQVEDLVALIQERYPGWDGFDYPPFVADEITVKRASSARVRDALAEAEVEQLLSDGQYDQFLERLAQLGKGNHLLWRAVPRRGDLAILEVPRLDRAEFCYVMRALLHGSAPTPERLQAFSDYARRLGLPNRWPFPTYYLFLLSPETELFVRPRVAQWFLQFVGRGDAYTSQPTAACYQLLRDQARKLMEALTGYQPRDMIDIQSFIWVCMRESERRTGRLDRRGQVELDVPPAGPETDVTYAIEVNGMLLRDSAAESAAEADQQLLPPYPLETFAAETGYDVGELGRWTRAVARKKQLVFYGPPGVGKTFLAERLARHLVGGGDGLIELVQFHPAYSYEEFVQGIRPRTLPDGRLSYEWVNGRFLDFCQRAAARQDVSVLIIDEINRSNLSRVFGELMYLLEYRDQEIRLAGGQPFRIPEQVRLVGTMNTADRSIALVDHALRRRFAFIHLTPNYDILTRYHQATGFPVAGLVAVLRELNERIGDPHYEVGISFFLRPELADELPDIWQMEIEPYLEEYFFDQPERMRSYRWAAIANRLLP